MGAKLSMIKKDELPFYELVQLREAQKKREMLKEKKRAYNQRYYQRPDIKEKKRAYNQRYYQRPDIKEKKRAHNQRYYQRRKREKSG